MWPSVELRELRVFLVLAEELHFGRTAERLHLTHSRVSQCIASLESRVGARLFERTSRRVRLTPLGSRFRDELLPGYQQIERAFCSAREAARKVTGAVRLGFTNTTEGPALIRLVRRYEAEHRDSTVTLRQVSHLDPYRELRRGELDILVGWLALDEPDLVAGPEIDRQGRVLAVSSRHPLAQRQSLTAEDLAGLPVGEAPPGLSKVTWETFVPTHTPGGRVIPRTHKAGDTAETYSLIARELIVHPTVASMAGRLFRDDIVLIPIVDLPPIALGLIWSRAREDARIRAVAEVARLMAVSGAGPSPPPQACAAT